MHLHSGIAINKTAFVNARITEAICYSYLTECVCDCKFA